MRTCTLMVMQTCASTLAKNMFGAQVGNRVGVKRCSDDTMHIFIDGEDMGSAATAVAKVSWHICIARTSGVSSPRVRASLLPQNVYAVFDLYGRITAVSIVSSSLMEDVESLKAPSLSSESCSEGEEDGTPVREVGARRAEKVESAPPVTVNASVFVASRWSRSPARWCPPS